MTETKSVNKRGNRRGLAFGGRPGPGRPKGLQNKITRQLKDMVLHALDGAGGVAYLQEQARKNPTAFLTLLGKVLPLQHEVSGPEGTAIRIIEVRNVISSDDDARAD